jgi:dCMP deaminase
MNLAKVLATCSPCSRRKCGALLIKDDTIIATGYNGSARGALNCGIDIPCLKDIHNEAHYTSFEHCPALHAEHNVIINAGRAGVSTVGATLYLNATEIGKSERPCHLCRRYMIQAGIKDCYYVNKVGIIIHEMVEEWIKLENQWMTEQSKNEG